MTKISRFILFFVRKTLDFCFLEILNRIIQFFPLENFTKNFIHLRKVFGKTTEMLELYSIQIVGAITIFTRPNILFYLTTNNYYFFNLNRVSLTYRVKSAHKVKLTDKQLLQWMVPILLVMLIYLGTWSLSAPPHAEEVIFVRIFLHE